MISAIIIQKVCLHSVWVDGMQAAKRIRNAQSANPSALQEGRRLMIFILMYIKLFLKGDFIFLWQVKQFEEEQRRRNAGHDDEGKENNAVSFSSLSPN